jgi:hypothetical protein
MKSKYKYAKLVRISCCLILGVWINLNLIYAQSITKVLISGETGNLQHDTDVSDAFMLGYSSYDNTAYGGQIDLYIDDLQSSYTYASNNGYQLIVRSYTGLVSAIALADDYPTIKLVMPSGSNTFEESFSGDVINSPVIITGAGIDCNLTGYKIDFFSIDPITEENLSSFANGYIAGQLSFIANYRGCSLEDARQLARTNGSNSGVFDYYDGFGKINIGSTLNAPTPVELSSFTVRLKKNAIILEWKTETEVNNYGFNIERFTDNPDWQTIGFIQGHGNSNSPNLYNFSDYDIGQSGSYHYRLKQIDNDGTFEYSDVVNIEVNVPGFFLLSQNYPNPFNPETKIDFTIPERQLVVLRIYNSLGQLVSELINEQLETGTHSVKFDASDLSGGVYFYSIIASGKVLSKKMTLLK